MTESSGVGPWYCYGVAEDRSWDCDAEPDPQKIKAIVPNESTAQAEPDPVAQAPQPQAAPMAPPMAQLPPPVAPPGPPQLSERQDPVITVDTTTERVLNTPDDYFAVQLIAMRDLSRVQGYATSNGIIDPMIVPVINQGQQWYLLLLGTFSTKAEAEEARAEWETTRILKVRPWIRRLKPLQEAIQANRNNG